MERTTNYQLKKPAASDYITPDPFNENADIIDAELKKADAHHSNSAVHVTAAQKTKWDGYETVHTLTHSRSVPGRFHALTGLNGATGVLSCQFKATAAFNAGDTFRVDGVTYAGKLADGKTAKTGLFVSGALVSCIIDTAGKTVNFKAGGGYAEGDVIAAGKLAEVYENAVKYSTLELIGEGALQWNERSFINPAGTIVYTYSSDNKVTTSTIDGTAIATVDTGRGFRCALGFDDAGNFYVQAYTSGSSYESVLRLNTDGTYQVFSDLWSALGTSMFWAYNSFYTHETDGSDINRYSTEGNKISSFYFYSGRAVVKNIKGLCGEPPDGSKAEPLYVFARDENVDDYLFKLTASGSIVWKAYASIYQDAYSMCYTPGYIYFAERTSSGNTPLKRLQLTENSATMDSSYSVTYHPHRESGFLQAVTLYGTAYVMDYGGKRVTLFNAATGEQAYNSDLYFADGSGNVYWNNEGKYYMLHPPITGYKILSDD